MLAVLRLLCAVALGLCWPCRPAAQAGTTPPNHSADAALLVCLLAFNFRHGDLKAGNVLLTANLSPCANDSCSDPSAGSAEVWLAAGSQPLSAKVADFGMAMPLGPTDTHAGARVSLLAGQASSRLLHHCVVTPAPTDTHVRLAQGCRATLVLSISCHVLCLCCCPGVVVLVCPGRRHI